MAEINELDNTYISMAHELQNKDQLINFSVLESYLEKHPEDVTKWIEHLEPILHPPSRYSEEMLIPEDVIQQYIIKRENEEPVDTELFCKLCNNEFCKTQEHPTVTILCKHTFHTMCYTKYQSMYDGTCCPTCKSEINIWHVARDIIRREAQGKQTIADKLFEKYKLIPEFKSELSQLKSQVSLMYTARVKLQQRHVELKKALLEKHSYYLHGLQQDINMHRTQLQQSDEYKNCKSSLLKYRKIENSIYRKYNLTLSDLIKSNAIRRMNWKLRMILQRHRPMHQYLNCAIRIKPGSKKWI